MTETAIVAEEPKIQLGIIPARTPHDVIVQASIIAKELKNIIRENKLSLNIQGREYVRVEGWSTMGAMLGVLPREVPELTRRLEDGSYEATVELIRISDGAVIGRASALVGMDEKDRNGRLTWGSRPEYARRSMAITRATGKAYRLGFSWIMGLAGFEPTPAEEVEPIVEAEWREAPPPKPQPQPQSQPLQAGNGSPKAAPAWNPVAALVENGICENNNSAAQLLNRYVPDEFKTKDKLITWGKLYRSWRDAGADPKAAAENASAGVQLE